jgi:NADPH:quinone reductase-like Zn-dependent oxidoreductase
MSRPAVPRLFEAMILGPLRSMTGSNKMGNMLARTSQKDLASVKELVEAGKVVPVIDRHYMLSKVPDALRHLEELEEQ